MPRCSGKQERRATLRCNLHCCPAIRNAKAGPRLLQVFRVYPRRSPLDSPASLRRLRIRAGSIMQGLHLCQQGATRLRGPRTASHQEIRDNALAFALRQPVIMIPGHLWQVRGKDAIRLRTGWHPHFPEVVQDLPLDGIVLAAKSVTR